MQAVDNVSAMSQQALINYFENIIRRSLLNRSLSSAGLVIGSGATTAVKIANTVTYVVNGVFKSKTTAEIAFTATTHDITANATSVQERCYLLTIDAAGTVTITAGAVATGAGNALLPELPTGNVAVIGYVRIAIAAGAPGAGTNFVAGTTALSDARLVGSAATYVNLCDLVPSFNIAQ